MSRIENREINPGDFMRKRVSNAWNRSEITMLDRLTAMAWIAGHASL